VSLEGKEVYVTHGQKSVVVDKATQTLVAMQGERVVLSTPISSGRRGHRTPNGTFEAGPYKALMHRSSLYDDAPMPYSVQVTGDIFIHGYSSVPERPASHGCIRVPTDGSAKFFYEWVDVGTPIEINGRWPG
jgi:lipoprotein-anchoring transpeptidase ErfK/SrfK